MIDESKSESGGEWAALPGGRWALALGFALIVGFSIVVIWSAIDRGKRASFERWEQVTGVEDRAYFPLPLEIGASLTIAAKLGGKPLYLTSRDTIGIRDSDVRRVSKDMATGLTIYKAANPKILPLKEREETYLLKVEIGRYVKVRAVEDANPN